MGIDKPDISGGDVPLGAHRDLFISYSSPDVEQAHAIRVALEASGYSCWMAPDDIEGTTPWAEQIAAAVAGCRAMLVLVSEASMTSRHVPKEAELAFGRTKPLIPVRLDEVAPHGALEYLLSLEQWIDVFPGPLEAHEEDLLSRIAIALAEPEVAAPSGPAPASIRTAAPTITPPPLIRPRSGARRVRRALFAVAALAAVIISILSFTQADAAILFQAQDLRVSPNQTQAGTTVTATGRGWAAGNPVEIQWDAAYGSVIGTGTSGADGSFSISFTVPGGAVPGNHAVWACQFARGTTCSPSNEFKVLVSTTMTVTADDPPVANPDSFATSMDLPFLIPDATLIANDSDPNGDPLCSTVRVIDGPTRGTLNRVNDTTWIYAPFLGTIGTDSFTYQVCDQTNGAWSNTARVTIDIRFAGAISLSPRAGRPGTSVTVAGSGFVVDWQVRVSWETTVVATRRADGSGSFSAAFEVPNVSPGTYQVTTCTVDTTACAGATFEVVPPPTTTSSTTTTTTRATTTTTTAAPTTTTGSPDTTTTATPVDDGSTTTTEPSDNAPPVVRDDEAVVDPGQAVIVRVMANDADPDGIIIPASLQIVEPAEFGVTQVTEAGDIAYTPGDRFAGTDGFRYEVCDDDGECATAFVSIRAAALPPCSAEGLVVQTFTVNPSEGAPGNPTDLTLRIDADRLAGCYLTGVQFVLAGSAWGDTAGFDEDAIRTTRSVPSNLVPGSHEIEATYLGTGDVLASIPFTVLAPAAPPPDEGQEADGGSSPWWPWLPIGAVVVGAGAWLARRRWRSPARGPMPLNSAAIEAETRARELLTQMRAADADLAECEAHHGRGVAVLPTGVSVGESKGGTKPYLLEFENPYAPTGDDGYRGWFYPKRKEPIRGVVLHTTEGMALPGTTADHVARYFATCHRPASAHAVVDATGCITLLPDEYTALHVPLANSASLGLVVCLTTDPDEQRSAIEHAARWCRAKSAEYGFPLERVGPDDWRVGGYGIAGHADLESDASDPMAPAGRAFPWEVLFDETAGPSKFPAAVPVKRGPGPDPCAALREKAARAHEAAAQASHEAAQAVEAAGGPSITAPEP